MPDQAFIPVRCSDYSCRKIIGELTPNSQGRFKCKCGKYTVVTLDSNGKVANTYSDNEVVSYQDKLSKKIIKK